MKKTYLMLLLALAGFGSSCTNEDDTQGQTATGAAGEIQLVFSGSGESTEYTKAIASESENKIKNLKVYLFGAATANATDAQYEYMETWTMTDAAPGGSQFILQPAGSLWTASIKPNELKGLPYLTLVCVANQDNLFNADGTAFAALTAVQTDAGGAVTTPGTGLDVFKVAYTAKLAADGIIKTPLAMTGTGTTKISGSVSKVAITLKRIVARFDIDNTTATSQLTIEHVSMGLGRPNASLFGVAPAVVGNPATDLLTYADVAFTGENANQGTLESAIYVYPNLPADKSFLIIKGKYKSPSTGEQIAVTYNIPVVKTPEDATADTPANYIAIDANSRYKLRITDVTESNIYSTFEVEDWTSGGGVIIKPDNAKPEIQPLTGTDIPTLIAGTYYRTADAGTFNVVMTSTGVLDYSRELATKAGEIDWLTIGDTTSVQKDGITETTFPITITAATGKRPVSLTFINQAASYDPDMQTTLTFVGPADAPVLTEVIKGHSKGNSVDLVSDPSAPKAIMEKAVGSYVSLNLFCADGLADITAPNGYSVKAVSTKDFITTYRVTITDINLATDNATIDFENKANASNKVTLTIEHKKTSKPSIVINDKTATYVKSTYNSETLGGTANAATADMYLTDGSIIYVKATCTESAEAGAVIAAAPSGVTVTEQVDAGIFKIEIPTATALTANIPVTVTFKNKVDENVTSTLVITPKSAAPTVVLADTNTAVTDNNNGSYTIDPSALSTNTFTLTVTAPTGAGITNLTDPFTNAGWLKLDAANAGGTSITAGGNQVYTFTSGDTPADTGDVVLTFTNTVTGGSNTTITLKKQP